MTSVTTIVAFIALLAVHQVLEPCPLLVKPRYTKLANQRVRKRSVKGFSAVNEHLLSLFFIRHSAEQAFEQGSAKQAFIRARFSWAGLIPSGSALGSLFPRYMTSI